MNPKGSELIKSHHAMRGIAAIAVLLYHFRDVTLAIGERVDAHTAFFRTGFIWVDFFFILSGFILSHVYGNAIIGPSTFNAGAVSRFYLARFARIYPLHAATLLVMLAVEVSAYVFKPSIADAFVSDRKDWGSILQHATLSHSWLTMKHLEWNVPSWSISTEAFAYLVFPLLLLTANHESRIVRGLLPLVVASIFLHTFITYTNVQEQQPLARCLAGFISGMLLYRFWRRSGSLSALMVSILQAAAMIMALIALHLAWSQAIVLIAFVLLILSTASDRGMLARLLATPILQLLGTLSYSMYMTHWIVYRLYWMYGDHVFAGLASAYSPMKIYLLKVFLLLVLTFVMSWLTYKRIELPARRYLNRYEGRSFA